MASIPAFPHKQIPNGYSTSGGGGCRATSRDNLYEDGDGELEREEFGEVGVGRTKFGATSKREFQNVGQLSIYICQKFLIY